MQMDSIRVSVRINGQRAVILAYLDELRDVLEDVAHGAQLVVLASELVRRYEDEPGQLDSLLVGTGKDGDI